MNSEDKLDIEICHSISKIKEQDWLPLQVPDFPFTDYSFLSALETTSCLGERTGWSPCYIIAKQNGSLLGVLILYVKTNSYGEYIFDFAWAQAAQGAGLSYYPKLVSAVPFSPATGSKILIHNDHRHSLLNKITSELILGARALLGSSLSSSLHFLFITESETTDFSKTGFLIRHSFQYHWKNRNYVNFDEFLSTLTGKRRREIVRERRQVEKQGVTIVFLTGDEITSTHADLMYNFYQSTLDKKQGFDYLTQGFFKTIFSTMKAKIHLVLALDSSNRPVAGALNLIGSERLFGRYWGCLQEYRSLHFEVCYYQGIEFCIRNQLKLFEAGAQGEHKFQRGFLPTLTFSAHLIEHPRLSHAIEDFVNHEKKQLELIFKDYAEHTPFLF